MSDPIFLHGMLGLGDNIYQRSVIRQLGDVVLVTSWPQLYADLPVRCVRPITALRTQAKNAARSDLIWVDLDRLHGRAKFGRIGYNGDGTILASMFRSVGLNPDCVDFGGPPIPALSTGTAFCNESGRYVVVRPATIRQEWRADARNPNPDYLCRAVDALRKQYTIISVADLKEGDEWAVEPLPFAHRRYHRGEMNVEQLLALVAGAVGVIGGTGWLLPMSLAYRVPMLLIHGGWGAANGPHRIFDPRIDISRVVQAIPDNYCNCNQKNHECDKSINKIDARIDEFAAAISA